MNAGKVFLGVLVGVAVGATLGILFAPNKGSKTRKIIKLKKDEYVDELEEKFNEFIGSVTEKFENLRGDASNLVNQGKHKVEDVEAEVISVAKEKLK
jgi:gas vesicle protein